VAPKISIIRIDNWSNLKYRNRLSIVIMSNIAPSFSRERNFVPPAQLDFLPSAGTSLLDLKRGVPVARPQVGWEARKRTKEKQRKNPEEACMQVRQQSATDTMRVRHTLCKCDRHFARHFLSPFHSAVELSGAEFCPTQRGWIFCRERARPLWLKREACRLHILEEVWKRGGKKKK
jgi:hypothetical protein